MNRPPKIGISRCLLGDAVRYDGKSKYDAELIIRLRQDFELLSVCPEVEAGLSIPRPAVQLTGSLTHPRLTGRDDPNIDITDLMHDYCGSRLPALMDISGFVFKSRSPSCGMGSTPVYIDGKAITETGSGLFAQTLQAFYPRLPVAEETDLINPEIFQDFKHRVFGYNARLD